MTEWQIDGARVRLHASTEAMARVAADQVADIMREAAEARGEVHAMFATGNSQIAFIDALVSTPDVPWDRTVVFHMDEYVGIGPDHPAGFQRWIRQRIVERTSPHSAYYVDGISDPDVECDRYAALLGSHPLDLCCLGIGENGHLAFNDPPVADFDDPLDVKIVKLDGPCRQQQVNEGHFADLDAVPKYAITVTIPALLRARQVIAVVPEARKARPVRDALMGPVATSCPASALRTIDHATVHLDPGSAGLLER
ncbi:MAG TPA: glucosamine-6-phosphate deaminase [Acidimicrobiales bacterium]|nr:glucosamine-6-phosphate deaminase [Acidimicrobiales bacterium]